MLGLSVANVVGVPAATWLGQHLGWRSAFWAVVVLSTLTMGLVRLLVPSSPGRPEATGMRELKAFASAQVWLTLLAGAVGFGGMFAVYTYISPTVTEVGGLGQWRRPGLPARLRSRHGRRDVAGRCPGRLVGLPVPARLHARDGPDAAAVRPRHPGGWWALPVAFAIPVLGSVVVVNLQLRLMDVAGEAQTVGRR